MVKFLGGKIYTRKEFEVSDYKESHKNLIKLRNWNKVQFSNIPNADSHKSILLTQIPLHYITFHLPITTSKKSPHHEKQTQSTKFIEAPSFVTQTDISTPI